MAGGHPTVLEIEGRTGDPAAGPVPASGELAEAPYFDPHALRRELTRLFRDHEDAGARRSALIERLKQLVSAARASARMGLESDRNGRRCAIGLSRFQDELIRLLYDYTATHIYSATNPSDAERMAIVATGGYGRGLLAPWSDIDLLFLLPYKQTPWGESVAEYMLYVLWDLGFKVGHATRTPGQCLKLAYADHTIQTALLDMRLVHGDIQLYQQLKGRFGNEVVRSSKREFADAKMAEREQRHRRAGESRYRVEPNIKDGKGGLRDLHTLHWLAKYLHDIDLLSGSEALEVFSSAEIATFRRCEDFLWTVRCFLHFLRGRAEERLSFDVQMVMASQLGYRDHAGLRAVERFMKHYFLIAKDVGDLTTILCSALEMQQLKSMPRLDGLLNPLTWSVRRRVRRMTEFRIDNGRLNISDRDVFRHDPVNLIRIFLVAEETGTFFHPAALRLLRSSVRLIDDKLRANPDANRIFLELLTSHNDPETILRRMNEADVLGRFIPDFGRVVSMMQFNMYHHYTVDEHLIRTIGQLRAIERGDLADVLPVSTEIIKSIQNRRALYVAALLHDVAKGRHESHSNVGARIARELCPRLGLAPAETETVTWLIREHLTMSSIAQSRDIGDPKLIQDFAAIVQSPERLKLLLLLTVADIRAVGPGTWNGWKGQLLRQLYWETEPVVAGGHTQISRRERLAAAQDALRAELTDWPKAEVERFIARHYDDYWLKTETRKAADHARLIRRAEAEGRKLATDARYNGFTAITELTIMAPNHPRLLALFAGACASSGANIASAHISTTRDGLAIDTFLLQREFQDDADEARRTARIGHTIERVLKGEVRLAALMKKRTPAERRISAFTVEPEAVVNNVLSDAFTVIEVAGLDRPGLLYDLTSALSDLSLDITSAHIATYGEKAVDVFYVTDLTGKKVTSEARQATIRERLEQVLRMPPPAKPGGDLPATVGRAD
jgi:[protein-PII] uridylyltransferase